MNLQIPKEELTDPDTDERTRNALSTDEGGTNDTIKLMHIQRFNECMRKEKLGFTLGGKK